MNILVIHEVNYLSKIIYEYQILPEILSTLGHTITIIDYDDNWQFHNGDEGFTFKTRVYSNVHRAYDNATVTLRRPGIVRLPFISRASGAVTGGAEILRCLKGRKPDVVLLYGMPTIGVQAVAAARLFGVPIVFRAIDVSHQLVPSAVLVPLTKVIERFVFKAVDFNIALTTRLKQYIASYGVPDNRIKLLPSGVDVDLFSPGPRNATLMSKWGIRPEDPVILFMGTIYNFSGLDRVIADMPGLLKKHPTAKLVVAGKGEQQPRLKEIARQHNVSESIVFTGLLPYAMLPDVIRSSDVCINPFELNGITRDILPTKLFQYMSCAKPVMATPLPGTFEFIQADGDGVIYCSLANFVDRLSDLISDKALQKEMGEQAREKSRAFDWVEIAKTMSTLLSGG